MVTLAGTGNTDFTNDKIGADKTDPNNVIQAIIALSAGVEVVSTPTLSVAGAYAAGDYVGPSTTPGSVALARANGQTGTIQAITASDKANQAMPMEIWLFNATVGVPLDNGAWSISDADNLLCVGVIPILNWYASALNAIGVVQPGWKFKCGAATTSLFYAIVTRGTPTYASGDLQLRFLVDQD